MIASSANVTVRQVPANAAHYVTVWDPEDGTFIEHGPIISESLSETLWGFVDPDGTYIPPTPDVLKELWTLYQNAESEESTV